MAEKICKTLISARIFATEGFFKSFFDIKGDIKDSNLTRTTDYPNPRTKLLL